MWNYRENPKKNPKNHTQKVFTMILVFMWEKKVAIMRILDIFWG